MSLEVSGWQNNEEFITKELEDLPLEVRQTAEVASDDEEGTGKNVPSSEIKNIFV